jgi:hypothetical protein
VSLVRTVVVLVLEVTQLAHVLSLYKVMSVLTEPAVRIRVLRLVHVRAADAATEHRALLEPRKALAFVDAVHDQGGPDNGWILAAGRRARNTVLEVDDREGLVSIAVYPMASDLRDVLSAAVEACLQSHVRLVGAESAALAAFDVSVDPWLVSDIAYALEHAHTILEMRAVRLQGRMDVVCAVAVFQCDCLREDGEGDRGIRTPVAAGGVACWLVPSDATDVARLVADVFLEMPRQTRSEKVREKMVEGKKRGFMLARHGRAPNAPFQTAQSGGKRLVSRVRGLIVNLQRAILEIPENWQTVAVPGHNRQDVCALSPKGPHTESGIAVAGELHSTQPWGYPSGFFGLLHQGSRSIN